MNREPEPTIVLTLTGAFAIGLAFLAIVVAAIAINGGGETTNPNDVWVACITARYDYDGEDFDAWVESAGYGEDFCIADD